MNAQDVIGKFQEAIRQYLEGATMHIECVNYIAGQCAAYYLSDQYLAENKAYREQMGLPPVDQH